MTSSAFQGIPWAMVMGLFVSGVAFANDAEDRPNVVSVAPPPAAGEDPTVVETDPPVPRLDLYGFAMLDAIYDIHSSHPDWQASLRPSKIPVNCPADPGCGEDGTTTLSVRQSRFGAKSYAHTPVGDMHTIFEFELYGVADDAGETTFRLRHAWGEIGQFGAGQTWSLFMNPDVFPNSIEYWGPTGMVFYRNVGMRWTPLSDDTMKLAVAIEHPGAAVDAGKVGQIDPNLGAGVVPWNQFPDATAQFRYMGDWGHVQISGILRILGVQGLPDGGEQVVGWGGNLSGIANVLEDQILLQVAYGHGIANYMNDGGSDVGPDQAPPGASPEAVPTLGWLAYLNHKWNPDFTSSLGYSEHRQMPLDGQTDTAFALGQYATANVLYQPIPDFFVGPEFIWGRLEHKNGDNAIDMRGQISAKYKFGATVAGKQQ